MRRSVLACLLTSALMGPAAAPGLADQANDAAELVRSLLGAPAESPTAITNLTATVSSRTVRVAGAVSFGGQDFVRVGDDLRGDNAGGEPAAAAGLDIDDLLMAYPSASQPNLVFGMRLSAMTGGGLPEGVLYNWDIAVGGGAAAGGSNWSIRAMRSSQRYQTASTNPYAGLFECTQTPPTGWTCNERDRVEAVFDQTSATLSVTVPLSKMKATPGSTITAWPRNGQPVWIRPSASGAYTFGEPSFDEATHDAYTIPARSVRIALAPAGTPAELVTFATLADLKADGTFVGTLTAGGPGSFDVWAKACFGDNCSTRSVRISVSSV